jgi:hypothetical protein
VFEELDGSLVFLRRRSALEGAEDPPFSLLWIEFARIEAILSRFQLPNHFTSPGTAGRRAYGWRCKSRSRAVPISADVPCESFRTCPTAMGDDQSAADQSRQNTNRGIKMSYASSADLQVLQAHRGHAELDLADADEEAASADGDQPVRALRDTT